MTLHYAEDALGIVVFGGTSVVWITSAFLGRKGAFLVQCPVKRAPDGRRPVSTVCGTLPRIKLQISSSAHDDRPGDVKQESSIQKSHFEAKAWFDTFEKMEHEEHVCSRKPGKVVVTLAKSQVVIASRVLTIEKDFKLTSEGDYEVSEPATLGF